MVFEKKMSVKDLIEQMREELKKEQNEIAPSRTTKSVKKKPVKKAVTKKTKTVKKKKK